MKDYLNINEAARETGLSIPTIRAKLSRGMLPNAHQVQEGKRQLWRIPFNDLIAAGLIDKVTGSNEYDQLIKTEQKELKETALITERNDLERELEHARELLARADQELEAYRQRERQLFLALETKQAQEQRRFSWFRRKP